MPVREALRLLAAEGLVTLTPRRGGVDRLMNQTRRYRMRSLYLRGGLRRSLSEHAAILEAVDRRDVEAAARLMSEHIQVPQRILQASPDGELVEAVPGRSGGRIRFDQTDVASHEKV